MVTYTVINENHTIEQKIVLIRSRYYGKMTMNEYIRSHWCYLSFDEAETNFKQRLAETTDQVH